MNRRVFVMRAPREDSDQPARSRSLIRSLLVAFLITNDAKFLYADNDYSNEDAQVNLSLRCVHMLEGTFSHFSARILLPFTIYS